MTRFVVDSSAVIHIAKSHLEIPAKMTPGTWPSRVWRQTRSSPWIAAWRRAAEGIVPLASIDVLR